MKAFILDRYGKKSTLRFGETPEPVLGEDDVLVEVHAAGLNMLDSKIRGGQFKPILLHTPPLILGPDMAGVCVRVVSHVTCVTHHDADYGKLGMRLSEDREGESR